MAQAVRPERCVVAVDGPSGSGKSTVSRRLATAIDGIYLDTGAMYRAITWAVLQAGVDLQNVDAIVKIAQETDLSIGTDPTVAITSGSTQSASGIPATANPVAVGG